MRRIAPYLAALAASLLLAGCDLFVTEQPGPAPVPAPPPPPQRSAESLALERYYARVQANLIAEGKLRTDPGAELPITPRILTQNFIRAALYEEYDLGGPTIVQRQTESRLHRFEAPVRLSVEFGATVDGATRLNDSQAVRTLAADLSKASGHSIRTVTGTGNFHILILNEDERRGIGPRLRELVPRIAESAVDEVVNLPKSSYCLVFSIAPADNGIYTQAVAVIRAEHPTLLRLSCLHEEITQGLGLANDSPELRPSIFNDDEEFALLTDHDRLLLTMLYDPRLKPGMTIPEALPIVEVIAAELAGGEG